MEHKNTVFLTLFIPLIILICGHPAYANNVDWSTTAQSTLSIFQFTTHVVSASIFCIGIGFLANACMKLKYHRDNPIQTPMSQPITMFILATVMLVFATFIMVSQTYVYNTVDNDASITKVFHSNLNPRDATPKAAVPNNLPPALARQEDHIDLDNPYG